MPAPLRRISSRRRLHQVRRLAVLRGRSSGQSTPRTARRASRLWALGSVGALLLLVLALFVGRRYTAQKLDVEHNIRAQIIPALEKQLGRKIEVGSIESDYFSRVILRDVVIGRDKNSPLGALLRTKKATIFLDAVSVVMGRSDPLQAVSKIALQSPQLFLERDARGKSNIADLFKNKARSNSRWRGQIEIEDGRFFLRDFSLRNASGQTLSLDTQKIKANANFSGAAAVRYSINVPLAFVGKNRALVRETNFIGTADSAGKWLVFDARWPSAPAPLLAAWAFRKGEVVAQKGSVGGRARVMWDGALAKTHQTNASGVLTLSSVDFFAPKFKAPKETRPIAIQNASGILKFADRAVESGGINLTAFQTPLRVAGKLAFAPVAFDIRAASNTWNAPQFLALAKSINRNAEFQRTQIQSAGARGQVRVTGDARNWNASGQLASSRVGFAHPQMGAGALMTPEVSFAIQNKNGPSQISRSQISADVVAARVEYSGARNSGAKDFGRSLGNWQASGNLRGNVQWSGNAKSPQLQVRVAADSLAGKNAQMGAWRASGAKTLTRWNGNQIAAQFGAMKLSGRHPQAGTLGARNLAATVSFAPRNSNVFSVRASADSALGSGANFPALRGVSWQSGALKSAINWRGESGGVRLEANSPRARGARLGAARMEFLRADVNVDSSGGAANFGARFNAQNANLQNAQSGVWRAAKLLGSAQGWSTPGRNRAGAISLQTDFEARDFSNAHNRFGSWNGSALRVVASTSDKTRGAWNGVAAIGNADVSKINLSSLSPTLSDRVSGSGVLTAKARFANFGGSAPTIKGRARLSQITLRGNASNGGREIPLRNIETQIAFGSNRLRLAGLRAQSEFGPIEADAQNDFSKNNLKLSLALPRVEVSGADLNPYLAASGIRLVGNARGRMRLLTTSTKTPSFQTRFDFALPASQVFARQLNGSKTPLRIADAHVRGAGNLSFASAKNWRFSGEAALAARHVADADSQTTGGARAAGFQIHARGTVAQNASGFRPQLRGEIRAANFSLPLAGAENVALQNAKADFNWQTQTFQIARFEAGAGQESKLLGHATLRQIAGEDFSIGGQMLLEKFDAARAQKMLQVLQSENGDSSKMPQIGGVLFARADFDGKFQNGKLALDNVGVLARLYRGRVIYGDNLIPIDAARLETNLQFPLRREIAIKEFVAWSKGARVSASGVLTPQGQSLGLDVDVNINTLRAQHLLNFGTLRPALEQAQSGGALDGLLSAQLHLGGTSALPKMEGRAALKLAQAFGLDIESASGKLLLETDANASGNSGAPEFRLAVSELAGVAEGAPFSGSLVADSAANSWKLALATDENVATNRLLGAAQASANVGFGALPLRGELGAKLNLAGTLKSADGSFLVAAGDGGVSLDTGTLRWRGRELGKLVADLRLQNGVLQARRFELARAGKSAQDDAKISIAGVLPVALDAPSLDAQVTVENERLSFVLEVMREIRGSLAARGQNVSYLDAVLKRLEGLPSTIEGRFDLTAQLDQSWRTPVVEVRSLRASDVSFQSEGGEKRRLPDVSARFIYDGNDNGAIAIQNAELHLPRETRAAQKGDDGESDEDKKDSDTSDDENDDLLIRTLRPGRIVPGGELALTAEILNADLQQIARWLPGMQNEGGAAAIKGRLDDFVLQLAGTTSAPVVTGSLQGENWEYRGYSLDRVRLDRFSIADGKLQIEPGALTVVKGDFQSAAAWGVLPWTWNGENGETGISFSQPLEVHLPVGKENFGALAGIFIPQIVNVGASGFSGEVTIGGTLNAPQLAGQAQIENGTFRFRSALAELDAGVQNLNGTLRFAPGNRLELGENGLSGKFVPADEVLAPTTGNAPTAARRARDARQKEKNPPPRLAGNFNLQGGVALNLDANLWREPRLALASQRYDLRLSLNNGLYSTATFSGVRDAKLLATLKTSEGAARDNQNLLLALSANGNLKKTDKDGAGRVLSFAALKLAPDFATGADALFRARARNFSGGAELAAMLPKQTDAAFGTSLLKAEGAPSQIELDDFRFDWERVAKGALRGVLQLDNLPAGQPDVPPFGAPREPRVQEVALVTGAPKTGSTPGRGNLIQAHEQDDKRAPLRVAGKLSLEQAELMGAPQSAQDDSPENDSPLVAASLAQGILSRLPNAPAFQVKLVVGKEVQFVSTNLRATISGDLDVGGTPRDPVIFGTLFTRSGSITFPAARARLESGELTVSVRRDPRTDTLRTRVEIDATARGRTGRYEITLHVSGPLDTGEGSTQDLRVDISSNPPLSSDQAFSRLLGTASLNRGDAGNTDELYARALVGFLSGPLFSGLERSLEKTLGLDSIALDYRVDEPIGVEIGKAIGDRLYVSYRRALSRSSGEKTPFDLRVEYRIKGDFQLGLETDETSNSKVTLRKQWRF